MKKRTLLKIILIPILLIVLIQGTLPFMTLVLSGLKSSLENNTIQMDAHMVENSQINLENEMNEKWRTIYKESDGLGKTLTSFLNEQNSGIDQFLLSEEQQKEYLSQVFPQLVNALQYNNTSSGVFLILANGASVNQKAEYQGFFVRDSDPQTKTATNTDLMMERGSKNLARSMNISLDNAWATDFKFNGQDQRTSDDFFYKPYVAALEHSDSQMENLGYWSRPFILEDHYMDSHKMITYSVPLKYNGKIYGVLGVEIGVKYLNSYFSVNELDDSLNAGYALMVQQKDGKYEVLAGKGALYDAVSREKKNLKLTKTKNSELYEVKGAKVGKQGIYAIVKSMNLYSNNVPYNNTKWVLCGFVTENSVYGLGEKVYARIMEMIILSTILAIICVCILVKRITKPVEELRESVRGGVAGIRGFRGSSIQEIDELHDVIENLTDAQAQTEVQLLEEKERYRIAVESSNDLFFTFRKKEQLLELVNSKGMDGIWDCKKHPEYLNNQSIHPDDRERVIRLFGQAKDKIDIEFRLRKTEDEPYIWVLLNGSLIQDEDGTSSRIVGCVHDINQRKMLEEAQKKQEMLDATTGFYRLSYGIKKIRTLRSTVSGGVLALLDIAEFSKINEHFGLVFGDLLLEQLAGYLRLEYINLGIHAPILIRAGADQILIWIPERKYDIVKKLLKAVEKKFVGITDEKYLMLNFRTGMSLLTDEISTYEGMIRTRKALKAAKRKNAEIIYYEELTEEEKEADVQESFEEVDPFDKLVQMNLSSIAWNLFDRGSELSVSMDMLMLKLKEAYSLTNCIITRFNREYLSNSMTYCWKRKEYDENWEGIVHCTESQYEQMGRKMELQRILPITEDDKKEPVFGEFLKDNQGLIFHMRDNNNYSGSILLFGIDAKVIEDEEDEKRLEEISSIIQNRVNLQRHDLSAQAKSDFLARMSHEIRTPMNGIIGMTEIALAQGQTEERREDCLKKIQSSSNYLLGLLNEILDMSKIESGKMHLVPAAYNIRHTIETVNTLMESKIKEHQIEFIQEITLTHEWFCYDEMRLNQVLVNLLGNAVKYTKKGGRVWLTVKEQEYAEGRSAIYFAVKDEGVGIAEDKQKLIFQSFEQADTSEQARRQGTGLGLAISNRLIHMMDSDIKLESTVNKGSTFSFTLHFKVVEKEMNKEEPPKGFLKLDGKKILIVEDNDLNMEIIHTIIESYGADIVEAHNGQEAVEYVKNSGPNEYDLILMDIMMPVMDGLEATKKIRKIPREDCRNIPIIAMSANAFDEDVKRSLASGMNGHLSKPVNIGKLEEVLRAVLE